MYIHAIQSDQRIQSEKKIYKFALRKRGTNDQDKILHKKRGIYNLKANPIQGTILNHVDIHYTDWALGLVKMTGHNVHVS